MMQTQELHAVFYILVETNTELSNLQSTSDLKEIRFLPIVIITD